MNAENLKGVFGGLPTPWDEKGRLDVDSLNENVRRCGSQGGPVR